MLLSSIIETLLSNQEVPYCLIDAASVNNLSQTHASVSFVKDSQGILMSIYNNGHRFDLPTLKALVERPKLRFMSVEELTSALASLKSSKISPFSKSSLFDSDIQLIIDEPISTKSVVLLVTDDPAKRIEVDIWDMQIMIENALIGGIFSHEDNQQKIETDMNSNLLEQLKTIDHLPVMPSIAADLLELQANPGSTVDDLVRIISHDPALTVQTLRYSNSALFGFSGQISNLHDAIFRVLGYETVLYMSLGAALGRAFKLPQTGRLSMNTFWKEATYRAALCQQLALSMPTQSRPPVAMVYLTGLLHNIGVVLMGNLFKTEFDWLNKMLTSRPEQSIITTEQNLFGCTHASFGKYLMEHWNMPEEIIAVVGEHHTPQYTGTKEKYVWLAQLAGLALSQHGLSDSEYDVMSNEVMYKELYQQLGISNNEVEAALSVVMQESNALDSMADTLCA